MTFSCAHTLVCWYLLVTIYGQNTNACIMARLCMVDISVGAEGAIDSCEIRVAIVGAIAETLVAHFNV